MKQAETRLAGFKAGPRQPAIGRANVLGAKLGDTFDTMRAAVTRRARLEWLKAPVAADRTVPHLPPAHLFLSEIGYVARAVAARPRQPLVVAPAPVPRVVLLVPGFATNAFRMRHMAHGLEQAGHKVKQWKLGFNLGPSEELFEQLSHRLLEVQQRYGQQVYLVGWSLGGVFAREIAKRHPEAVAKVVTLGSPFSHTPHSNRVWRTYQLVTGHAVDNPPVTVNLREKPPVETVAMWSPRDAVISPRAARGLPGERDRAVALRCTHIGFSNSPEAIAAILKELE